MNDDLFNDPRFEPTMKPDARIVLALIGDKGGESRDPIRRRANAAIKRKRQRISRLDRLNGERK